MELRHYWKLIKRRWLLILLPMLVVLAAGVASYRPPAPAFNVGVRFIVGQTPLDAPTTLSEEQRYYNWLTSEYVVNGLTDWIRGGGFATAVSDHLATQGHNIPAGAIQGGIGADNTRSMLTVSLTAGDAESLAAMMDGVIVVLTEQNADALPQLGGETAVLTQLDQPFINPVPPGVRQLLDLIIRAVLAVGAGLGLALLAEYFDPRIQDRAVLDEIGLSILGEIPRR